MVCEITRGPFGSISKSFWLVSSEDPSVDIFTAPSRLQSHQHVALVDQILAVERQVMPLVGDSLVHAHNIKLSFSFTLAYLN